MSIPKPIDEFAMVFGTRDDKPVSRHLDRQSRSDRAKATRLASTQEGRKLCTRCEVASHSALRLHAGLAAELRFPRLPMAEELPEPLGLGGDNRGVWSTRPRDGPRPTV